MQNTSLSGHKNEIIHILPHRLRAPVGNYLDKCPDVEEIRIRVGQRTELRRGGQSIWLDGRVTADEIAQMMTFVSRYSIYAYEEEIRNGFLTIEGGHRIGFAGQVRLEHGQVFRMTNLSFLNIRIAAERRGCAAALLPWLYEDGAFFNTLLVSKPGVGKTTCLRDCVRMISEGELTGCAKKVCVIDERSEIAACHLGVPQNDVGCRTDVLDGCPKQEGMRMALRSMSPDVIAVDELGGAEDAKIVEQMILGGCRVIGTLHGEKMEHIIGISGVDEMYRKKLFQRYVFLHKKDDGERGFCIYNEECERLC